MLKKIFICAVIALVLVPASVMAAGFGGNGSGTAPGQGQCLHDGQNCVNQTAPQGTGTEEQHRYGMQINGAKGSHGDGDCQCTGEQKQTRSMLRLHDGSGRTTRPTQ
jgi:hypothetical protein